MNTSPPYEVAQESGGRAFLAFELSAGVFLLPWHSLRVIRLAPEGESLVFEYTACSIEVSGSGLSVLAEIAGTARLKTIRTGETAGVRIHFVRALGGES